VILRRVRDRLVYSATELIVDLYCLGSSIVLLLLCWLPARYFYGVMDRLDRVWVWLMSRVIRLRRKLGIEEV